MADTKLQEFILHGDLIAQTNTSTPPYSPYKLPTVLDGLFTASLAAARAANSVLQLAASDQAVARGRNSAGDGPASNKVQWTAA